MKALGGLSTGTLRVMLDVLERRAPTLMRRGIIALRLEIWRRENEDAQLVLTSPFVGEA